MLGVHLKKLRKRVELSDVEEQAIRAAVAEKRQIPADRTVARAGEELHACTVLLHGWMARVKDLPSGERQVTELHVPGDFTDMHAFTLKCLDHDVISLSDCTIGVLPFDRLREITDRFPRLARVYWLMTNMDAAIQREWALSLGQRSAMSRMAHLFCELYERLHVVGLASSHSYEFPLTQRELSECLGLTVVHANRTLQHLRRRGMVELESRRLTMLDHRGLCGLAQFDASYLYLDHRQV